MPCPKTLSRREPIEHYPKGPVSHFDFELAVTLVRL
jgi:hypothetical protein